MLHFVRVLCNASQVKDEQADAVKKRIRQWESENRVLGHHARSDVHRPRALLVLSGTWFLVLSFRTLRDIGGRSMENTIFTRGTRACVCIFCFRFLAAFEACAYEGEIFGVRVSRRFVYFLPSS